MATAESLLRIVIKTDNQATQGLDKVQGRLDKLGKGMRTLGSSLTKNLTLPILAIGATMLKAAADFDSAMTNMQARTGATADEMEALRKTALEMGRDTAFSATDAAKGLLQLTSSGSSAAEAIGLIHPVLDFAAAGMIDLETAADATTDILKQFQLETDSATWLTNALTKASQSSSATISDLIAGFQNAGTVMKNFGLNAAEGAAALATLAEAGLKGSEAGTALRSMLNNMTRQTSRTQGAWKRLGTSFFDAEGNARRLDDVIDDIKTGLKDMTDQERIATIQDLAGTYGQTALNALLAADGIDAMQHAMGDSQTASQVADAQMKSFAGSVNQLKSSWETLSIQVITPFMNNVLAPLLQMVTSAINYYTAWAAENQKLSNIIVGLVAGLALIGPALWIIGSAVSIFGTITAGFAAFSAGLGVLTAALTGGTVAATAFGVVMAVITSPITLVVAAFAALAAGILLLIVNWDKVSEFTRNALLQLGLLGEKLFNIGKDIVEGLARGIASGAVAVFEATKKLVDGIVGGVKSLLGISSPSTVMADAGRDTAAGFTQGFLEQAAKDAGRLSSALPNTVSQRRAGAAAAASAGGGRRNSRQVSLARQRRNGNATGGATSFFGKSRQRQQQGQQRQTQQQQKMVTLEDGSQMTEARARQFFGPNWKRKTQQQGQQQQQTQQTQQTQQNQSQQNRQAGGNVNITIENMVLPPGTTEEIARKVWAITAQKARSQGL